LAKQDCRKQETIKIFGGFAGKEFFMKIISLLVFASILFMATGILQAEEGAKSRMDSFNFGSNKLNINFYGHASLMLDYNGLYIYVDPVTQYAKYESLPKADIILVTHEHGDHFDISAIEKITKDGTAVITNQNCANQLKKATAMKNGQDIQVKNIKIEAVPAYNTTKEREQFHPKGRDNGFIVTLGSARVYIAGDTEDIPEMANIKNIDIAFLPANQPYTMTESQIDHAAQLIKPKVLYPYHLGETNSTSLEKKLKENKNIDVRMRDMK
jgi:L-ascorbate metabolism protein UlaG (beta-lactamase superfamily)